MSGLVFEDLMKSYNNLSSSEKEFIKDESFNHRFFNNEFSDYKVVEDINMVDVKIDIVNKIWKERLLTLPWKPWIKTKIVEKKIPKQKFYVMKNFMGEKVIVCHPVMVNRLKKLAKNFNAETFERMLKYYNKV